MDMGSPYLEITVQPIKHFRFRYASEMKESHGSLTGELDNSWPTVCLRNFSGKALILCSLYQVPEPDKEPMPHSHSLIVQNDTEFDFDVKGVKYKKDPHAVTVSLANGHQATFEEMKILNRKLSEIKDELFAKFVAKSEFDRGCALTPQQKDEERATAVACAKKINLKQAVLCFKAYEWKNDKWMRLCAPVFSTAINDEKSAALGKLEIRRISAVVGCATGDEDLFLCVNKVDKDGIRVRFYEQNGNGDEIWEAFAEDIYVHYQYAIVLKTPPFRETNIKENVKVFIQLYRSRDDTSDSIEFHYKPIDTTDGSPKVSSSSYSELAIPGGSKQSPQHHPLSDDYQVKRNHQEQAEGQSHVHQDHNTTFDELFEIMPELKDAECDPQLVDETINWMVNVGEMMSARGPVALERRSEPTARKKHGVLRLGLSSLFRAFGITD